MTDFRIKVFGLLAGVLPWSFSRLMTGPVSEAMLAGTLDTSLNTLWTTGVNGIQNLTGPDVTLEGSQASTLNATLHELSKTVTARHIAGTGGTFTLPYHDTVVIGFTGPGIQKADRGRIRLPPLISSTMGAGGLYSAATTASLKAVLDVFFPALRAGGMTYFSSNTSQLVDGTLPFNRQSLTKYHISNEAGVLRHRTSKQVPTFTQSSL